MEYPPPIETSFLALPQEASERHEFFVDIFGRYLFWALEKACERTEQLIKSDETRAKLGRVFQKPYLDAATQLSPEQQEIAIRLAQEPAQAFAKILLQVFQAQGITHRLGEDHAVRFRLILEVCDVRELTVALEEVINRGGEKAFSDYWGRWLNQAKSL